MVPDFGWTRHRTVSLPWRSESHELEMTENPQSSETGIRQTDVSRLPFTAGVVLAISGLNTVVLGLYSISSWQGWLFIGLGIAVGASASMLIVRLPLASLAAAVAALASLTVSAVWVAMYPWFNMAAIGLDLLAIYALGRTKLRLRTGRDPLRT